MLSSRHVECVSAVLLERHIRYASTQSLPGQLRLGVLFNPKSVRLNGDYIVLIGFIGAAYSLCLHPLPVQKEEEPSLIKKHPYTEKLKFCGWDDCQVETIEITIDTIWMHCFIGETYLP